MATNGGKLDEAARAGWLYYVAGNTQDQIAQKLGVSRQSAQRLVSLAVSEGLVKVRIDHPIANCLELSNRLLARYDLKFCEVAPTDPAAQASLVGVAQSCAAEVERWLGRTEPLVVAIGTGRTLKAAVEHLPRLDCPQHRIVSLTGNISPDGSAAYYNVIFSLADKVSARSFPMPLPVIASSHEERDMLHSQTMIRPTLELADKADVVFVGIGELGQDAPLCVDGFLTGAEMAQVVEAGGVGEIVGWIFDARGRIIGGDIMERVASARLPSRESALVVACAVGPRKAIAIRAAMEGGLANGLITDEATAELLLK